MDRWHWIAYLIPIKVEPNSRCVSGIWCGDSHFHLSMHSENVTANACMAWWDRAKSVLVGDSYSLTSPLSVDECRRRLESEVKRSFGPHRSVRGKISQRTLSITRTGARNDFRPTAIGRLHPVPQGTVVTVRMHSMRPLLIVLLLGLFVLGILALVGTLVPDSIPGGVYGLLCFDLVALVVYGVACPQNLYHLQCEAEPLFSSFRRIVPCDWVRWANSAGVW